MRAGSLRGSVSSTQVSSGGRNAETTEEACAVRALGLMAAGGDMSRGGALTRSGEGWEGSAMMRLSEALRGLEGCGGVCCGIKRKGLKHYVVVC